VSISVRDRAATASGSLSSGRPVSRIPPPTVNQTLVQESGGTCSRAGSGSPATAPPCGLDPLVRERRSSSYAAHQSIGDAANSISPGAARRRDGLRGRRWGGYVGVAQDPQVLSQVWNGNQYSGGTGG
jgi:hypothetical protein